MTDHIQILIDYISIYKKPDILRIKQLHDTFSYKKIPRKKLFLKAGDKLKHVGFIIKGLFKYYYIDYEGRKKIKYFVAENDFVLSLTSLIENIPSLFFIEALEDSEVLAAPVDKMIKFINYDPTWKEIYKSILEKNYIIKEKREAEFLLCNAEERYLRFINDNPGIYKRIKRHYIASYLGIAPESLSRISAKDENS